MKCLYNKTSAKTLKKLLQFQLTKRRVVIGEHTVDMRKATPKPDKMAGGGGAGGWGPQGMGFGGPGKP